jgi:hypothetical protein
MAGDKRPSEIYLALFWRRCGTELMYPEFRDLAETWLEIREMEVMATRPASLQEVPCFWDELPEQIKRSSAVTPEPESPSQLTEAAEKEETGAPEDEVISGEMDPKGPEDLEIKDAPRFTGYMAAAKNQARDQLIRMRAGGLKIGMILKQAGDRLTFSQIMDICEAKPTHFSVYQTLQTVLNEIEAGQ